MSKVKDFFKKFLPLTVNVFNREMKKLQDELSQQDEKLYRYIEVQAESFQLISQILIGNYNQIEQTLIDTHNQMNGVFMRGENQIEKSIADIRSELDALRNTLTSINNEAVAVTEQIIQKMQSIRSRQDDSDWQIKNEMRRYCRLFQELNFYRIAVEKGLSYSCARKETFKSLPKAEESQRRLQLMELFLLGQLQQICEENGLRYWISDGTLLGALRHDGFIPWDDDMDVSMPREDFERLRFILSSSDSFQIVDYYCLSQRQFFSKISKFVDISSGTNVFIDVFPYDFYDVPSVQEARTKYWKCRSELADDLENLIPKLKYRYCDCMVDDPNDKAALDEVFQRHVEKLDTQGKWMGWSIEIWDSEARAGFPTDSILPCAEHVFEELVVSVPRKPDECLQQVYGEYMLFPLDVGYQNHTALFGLDQQDEAVSAYLKRNGVAIEEEHRGKDDTQ